LLAKYPNYTIYGTKPAVGMLYYDDIRGAKSTTPDANGNYTYAEADGKIDDNDLQYLTNKKITTTVLGSISQLHTKDYHSLLLWVVRLVDKIC
jgi:hypothetical protein